MSLPFVRDLATLFVGDIAVFAGSLWLALVARHFVAPNSVQFFEHLVPFSILFVVWLLVFVSMGLYDRTVALFEHRLPATIFQAQAINLIAAVAFFFIAPIAIQPKTILALYFVISTLLFVVWRLGVFRLRSLGRGSERATLVGHGADIDELVHGLRISPHTSLDCTSVIDSRERDPESLKKAVHTALSETRSSILIRDPRLIHTISNADFPNVLIIDAAEMYEALYSRVPLSLVHERALDVPNQPLETLHDAVKRVLDLILSLILLVILLLILPFVYLAMRLEDSGAFWISQERIGRNWRTIFVHKIRTMSSNDAASGSWVGEGKNRVTRVGAFLRRTSIDELPQIFSVLKGELSLIGPRSDIRGLGERLREEIELYPLRYRVTPGISGWAQVNQRYAPGHISPQSIEESRVRLMYDLYYVKHRSVFLDLYIAAKTISTLFARLIP